MVKKIEDITDDNGKVDLVESKEFKEKQENLVLFENYKIRIFSFKLFSNRKNKIKINLFIYKI